jgi:hypothetical protein
MSTHAEDISREMFIEAKLPEVIADEVENGDVAVFWEALGPDGFEQYFKGHMNAETAKEKKLAELRRSIADEDYDQVGKLVSSFVIRYFEEIEYYNIDDGDDSYGEHDFLS